ncbi:MAG: hypothetical protein FWC40_09110 [Proteobacteria bacterium]|nr:hypothetical protein [Pseudomonadota bacterium]
MSSFPVVLACRDSAEAKILKAALGHVSLHIYHHGDAALERLSTMPNAIFVTGSLLADETAASLIAKSAVIGHVYSIVIARQAAETINLLRLYGSGCKAVLGPDELDLLRDFIGPEQNTLNELVMPPFFIDDDISPLKEPAKCIAKPIHITCLGQQALMSCCNAILNIAASEMISMACVAPGTPWAKSKIAYDLAEYTLWHHEFQATIASKTITFCQDFNALAALEPTSQHFVLCHGALSEQENAYIQRLPTHAAIFVACSDGYVSKHHHFDTALAPERLWSTIISALYA